jgi:hypothetical protein
MAQDWATRMRLAALYASFAMNDDRDSACRAGRLGSPAID